MNRAEKEELYRELVEKERRIKTRKIYSMYPETGPLRRELYVPHMKFFDAGKLRNERGFMAAHRVGKTWGTGGYELVCHATGLYPDWWPGYRFKRHIRAWACGDTNQTTKDILQTKLLGPLDEPGTGLIPFDCLSRKGSHSEGFKRKSSNVPDVVETIFVEHITGGVSQIGMRSYEQTVKAFYGTEQDVILLDEEPKMDIYTQCLIRTLSVVPGEDNGLIILTFTPLEGMSEVVTAFMKDDAENNEDGKHLTKATWDDAPHLDEKERKKLWKGIPVRLRDAMTRGIPSLGEGAIYPIDEENLLVDDFKIPDYWPKVYGLDMGWNNTAALWAAIDRDNDIVYLTSEYKQGHSEPPVHAHAIKSRGDWIPGVSDPSKGTSQRDGEKLLEEYQALLGNLYPADNAVEAGIHAVWMRMTTGRLKVFRSLTQWKGEFRIYQRGKDNKPVKENDHLMDDTKYIIASGLDIARTMPIKLFGQRNNMPVETYNPLTFGLKQNEYDPISHGMGSSGYNPLRHNM